MVDPVHPEELLDALRRDPRVEQVVVRRETQWRWTRAARGTAGDGHERVAEATVGILPNTHAHGAGGRGIAAGVREPIVVARIGFDADGLINACELIHSQQYGLVRLVADALGAHE